METMRVLDGEICYRAKECKWFAKLITFILYFPFLLLMVAQYSRSHCPQIICHSSGFVSNSLYTSKSKGIKQSSSLICFSLAPIHLPFLFLQSISFIDLV